MPQRQIARHPDGDLIMALQVLLKRPGIRRTVLPKIRILQLLKPSRIMLLVLLGVFIVSMAYVLKISTLVSMGGELRQLEQNLAYELQIKHALQSQIAETNDLGEIERAAYFDLDLVEAKREINIDSYYSGKDTLKAVIWPSRPPAKTEDRLQRALLYIQALVDSHKQSITEDNSTR